MADETRVDIAYVEVAYGFSGATTSGAWVEAAVQDSRVANNGTFVEVAVILGPRFAGWGYPINPV